MVCKSLFARPVVACAACAVCFFAAAKGAAAPPVPFGAGPHTHALLAIEAALGAQSSAQQVLTNEDVIKMVQAHLGVDVILEQIRTSTCNFSLSTSGLIGLKEAGVPDQVIEAMQAKNAASKPTGSGQSPQNPNHRDNSEDLHGGMSGNPGGVTGVPAAAQGGNASLPSSAQLAPPFGDLMTLDAESYNRLTDPRTILNLNFMRLVPHALDDDALLADFSCINNNDDQAILRHLDSEFDYPQTVAYYKAKAADVLAGAPSTISLTDKVELGEYDRVRQAFAVINRLDARECSISRPGMDLRGFARSRISERLRVGPTYTPPGDSSRFEIRP